jgi:DmsE family decaheme c-type cytochrome
MGLSGMRLRAGQRVRAQGVAGLVLVFLAAMGMPAASFAQTIERPAASSKDMVLVGDAKCTECHDESEKYPVLAIGKTRHGTKADARTPSCISCHGESATHVKIPTGTKERPKPERFGRGKNGTVEARNQSCMDCHQGGARMLWGGSTHEMRDVACSDCHQIHTGHDKVREKKEQPEVCFTCHKQQRVQINRPSRHPILEGKVACSDCHNAHGSAGPKLMVRDTINTTCFQCHAEKRGPFIWNHEPVSENCAHCHNPHGTTVASLLKWRPPFLCQQCHEPSSHRGNIPNVDWASSATTNEGKNITLGRSCLNCHTNIHGGSNPLNLSHSRSLRR